MKTNMLSNFFTVFLIVTSIGFYSCGGHFPKYGSGYATKEVAYMHKPFSADSTVSANYVSVAFSRNGTFDDGDRSHSGEFSYHRSNSFRKANLAYGAYGYYGVYQVKFRSLSEYHGDKSYYGYGFRASANLNKHIGGNINYRYLGIFTDVNHEHGSFREFREEAERNNDLSNKHPASWSSTIGLNTEFVVKVTRVAQIGGFIAFSWNITELADQRSLRTIGAQASFKKVGASFTYTDNYYVNKGSSILRLHYQF